MIKFETGNTEYTLEQHVYSKHWFTSREKNLTIGGVRLVGNKLFYIRYINDCNVVHWAPVEKDSTKNVIDPFTGLTVELVDQKNKIKWFSEEIIERNND